MRDKLKVLGLELLNAGLTIGTALGVSCAVA